MKNYWAPIQSKFGHFAAWVDGEGRLIRFNLSDKNAAKIDPSAERNDKALSAVQKQIAEYDAGKRREFDFERKMEGPQLHQLVWEALMEIPFGETTSYGAIANKLGFTNGARTVGVANAENPIAIIVPCHRVIGSDGTLTGFGGGLPMKRALLEHEARVCGRKLDLFG